MNKILNKLKGLINYPVTAMWSLALIIYINTFNEESTLLSFIFIGLIATGLGYTIFENQKYIHLKVFAVSSFYSLISYLIIGVNKFNVRNQKMIVGIIGVMLFIFFAKLLREGLNFNNIFVNFIIHLGLGVFSTLLYAILVFVINELFNINIKMDIVISIWIVIFTVIFSLFFSTRKKIESKILNNIFSAFVIAFLVILYMGLFSKEQSLIMHLILWLGYLMAGLNTVIKKKYVSILTIPLVIYMIYISIKQISIYDVTENRYFILTFGIFLLCVLLLQLINDIETVNYSKAFALFIAIVFFFPYINAFDLTERRMINNFKRLYALENINEKDKYSLNSYYYYLKYRDIEFDELNKYAVEEEKLIDNNLYETYYYGPGNVKKDMGPLKYIQDDVNDQKEYIVNIKGRDVNILELIEKEKFENDTFIIYPIRYSIDKNKANNNYFGNFEILIEEK
ncbi:DUF4153 domain-containing protein [Streptobacillus felis]|uniref:DUF4153 domain-containing protein n=1 Tax=Streptobacillus felis TaxID=1384509 RepID=A0A7Z0PEC3_9FUSO|nr:DUF4153 domain-containing protein [Streptobacillus felis]NYV27627.1 DUF4153 domain-containing protein [Streptobacillus felis]